MVTDIPDPRPRRIRALTARLTEVDRLIAVTQARLADSPSIARDVLRRDLASLWDERREIQAELTTLTKGAA